MKKCQLLKFHVGLVCLLLVSAGCGATKNYTINENLSEEEKKATVKVKFKETAIGIGYARGEGILSYQGEEYPFTMKGFDYGSISTVQIDAIGSVFHMEDLEEFEGLYFQAKAAFTMGRSGKSGMWLMNSKGVTIHLKSEEQRGIDLTLGRGGIKIRFAEEDAESEEVASAEMSAEE